MVYVSCTTTKQRLGMLYYTYVSLTRQSTDDFVFCVNISREPYLFDKGFDEIPDWLMNRSGIEVNWVENTGSYRKLLPKVNELGSDDVIVTCDDDILYDGRWLESLLESAERHPDSVICGRARRMKDKVFFRQPNYNEWPPCREAEEGRKIVPVGCGGVLYRRRFFHADFLNDPKYQEIAPTSDDLWFKAATLAKGTSAYVDPRIDEANISLYHGFGLYDGTNSLYGGRNRRSLVRIGFLMLVNRVAGFFGIGTSKNDRAWKRIVRHLHSRYGMDIRVLVRG